MASNTSTLGSGLRAKDIRLNDRYATRTEEGLVVARVVKALPLDKKQIALDVYNYRARSYQEASDHLCYLVQTHQAFAWCRPLMDPRYMVPIDYLHVEMLKTDDVSKSVVSAILRRVLRLGRSGDQRTAEDMIANKASGLVRGTEVDEMNGMLRGLSHARARFWLKRDYAKMVDDKAKAEAGDTHLSISGTDLD